MRLYRKTHRVRYHTYLDLDLGVPPARSLLPALLPLQRSAAAATPPAVSRPAPSPASVTAVQRQRRNYSGEGGGWGQPHLLLALVI